MCWRPRASPWAEFLRPLGRNESLALVNQGFALDWVLPALWARTDFIRCGPRDSPWAEFLRPLGPERVSCLGIPGLRPALGSTGPLGRNDFLALDSQGFALGWVPPAPWAGTSFMPWNHRASPWVGFLRPAGSERISRVADPGTSARLHSSGPLGRNESHALKTHGFAQGWVPSVGSIGTRFTRSQSSFRTPTYPMSPTFGWLRS
jgi:hypothetical protein